MTDEVKKSGRGKGVKPAMVYVSFRLEKEIFDFFNIYPNRSEKIREVLLNYIIAEGYERQILELKIK